MRVLSLFDGMACGMISMLGCGVDVERYVAYEIDKYATQTSKHNFPNIEQNGDVFEADFTQYEGFDFLVGGSPCTYWSIAQTKNRETVASGMGWELFQQYVRALHEAKPKAFIYENNKSMSQAIRESISEAFGFEPICINSALVSAQNRQRLYWVGIRQQDGSYKKVNIEQPKDRGILLRDILETNSYAMRDKGHAVIASAGRTTEREYFIKGQGNMCAEPIKHLSEKEMDYMCRTVKDGRNHFDFGFTADATKAKAPCVSANICKGVPYNTVVEPANCLDGKSYEVRDGMITVKGKQYPIKLVDGYYIIRKLTVRECMRLQTVPEWYEFPVSNSQAYKMLGNGWTCEVIMHLIRAALAEMNEMNVIDVEEVTEEEISVIEALAEIRNLISCNLEGKKSEVCMGLIDGMILEELEKIG